MSFLNRGRKMKTHKCPNVEDAGIPPFEGNADIVLFNAHDRCHFVRVEGAWVQVMTNTHTSEIRVYNRGAFSEKALLDILQEEFFGWSVEAWHTEVFCQDIEFYDAEIGTILRKRKKRRKKESA